jgi:type IV pilus assembly protein PilW
MMSNPVHAGIGRHRTQAGLGLIELMVAATIGLFIALAIAVVYGYVKQAFNSQDQLSQLQDNERLALTMLSSTVELAGYFPDPLVSTAANDMPAVSGTYGTLAAGQGIVGATGVAPASDTIATRYVSASGDGLMDCLGQTYASGSNQVIVNYLSVNASNELTCAVSVNGGALSAATALVSNVSSVSVLYGTDTSAPPSGNPTRYLTATAVTAGTLWAQVKTARITLSLLNPFAGQPGQPATISWVQTVNLMNKP